MDERLPPIASPVIQYVVMIMLESYILLVYLYEPSHVGAFQVNAIKAFFLFFGFPILICGDPGGPAFTYSGQLNPFSRFAILCFISPVGVHKITGKHIGSGECTCVLSEHLWYVGLKILSIEYSRYRVTLQGNDDFVCLKFTFV